ESDVAMLQGGVYRRKGDIEGSIAGFKRCFALNPRDPITAMNLGQSYRLARKYDDAKRVFEAGIKIGPDQADIPLSYAEIYLYHTGEVAAARAMLARILHSASTFRSGEGTYPMYAARVELFDRKP